MKEISQPTVIEATSKGGKYKIEKYTFSTKSQAIDVFNAIPCKQQDEMAEVYQAAFAGPPWFEKYNCPPCGDYKPVNVCEPCDESDLPKAYPKQDLIYAAFPHMLETFNPGILMLSFDDKDSVNGFSTGGFTTPEGLVKEKYQENPTILKSIKSKFDIDGNTPIFYDNETCIDPARQQGGMGRKFSEERIITAMDMGAENISGRTINLPWLGLKERQLTAVGYDFESFTPEGDTYAVDGVQRKFYLAKKKLQ